MNSTRDHDIACNPNVVSNNDWLCILAVRQYIRLIMISISLLITEGVDWGHDADVWAHENIVSNFDRRAVQNGKVKIREKTLTDFGVNSVVKIDGRNQEGFFT